MQRFAFVTGTSRGIGQALAEQLLERGWTVVGAARSAAPASLQHANYQHECLDLADLGAVRSTIERVLAGTDWTSYSAVALVNNAGLVAPVGAPDQLNLEQLDASLRVNLSVPMWIAGRFLAAVPQELPLRLVHLGSGAATSPYSGWSAYCAGKAGLAMAARCLAQDAEQMPHLAARDLRVLDYAPGVVATEMQTTIRSVDEDHFPNRARFVELFESGALAAPEGPGTELADLLESAELPSYSARRFGQS
ncbi:MAG: benzil reductase ((S)-benzoin forming) [Planctomycetota bacterium]|jgi:benzil reductase ((S)-benzoin forming)